VGVGFRVMGFLLCSRVMMRREPQHPNSETQYHKQQCNNTTQIQTKSDSHPLKVVHIDNWRRRDTFRHSSSPITVSPIMLAATILVLTLCVSTKGFSSSPTSYSKRTLCTNTLVPTPMLQLNPFPIKATKDSKSRSFVDALEKEMQQADEVLAEKTKTNDTFVIKNVESIMVESPQAKHFLFGDKSATNKLDISKDPLVNELRVMRDVISSCPEIWTYTDALIPEKTAIYDEHLCDNIVNMTYHQVNDAVHRSAAAFTALGIKEGDHVAVFGENSAHWLFVDHGIQRCGGATVVRGAESPIDELRYIYDNSDAHQVVVLQGPSLLKKLAEAARKDGSQGIGLKNKHGDATTVVLLHREGFDDDRIGYLAASLRLRVLCLSDMMNKSSPLLDRNVSSLV
jgi:hypothetical protein